MKKNTINLRSYPALLFTPGNKPERFQKGEAKGANGIIFDLEDSVAGLDKTNARKTVIDFLANKPKHENKQHTLMLIRINHLSNKDSLLDLIALQEAKIFFDGIIYPKAESADEINIIHSILKTTHPEFLILAFIETAKGLSRVDQIVNESDHLSALLFGAADYAVDVGAAIHQDALRYARLKIVEAAALKKLPCYDSPFFDFKDQQGLIDETLQIKKYGYTGKLAIHPEQIAVIKKTFKPSDAEFADAKAMVQIFEAAKGDACQYKGKMIDVPVYQKAKQIIELYQNLS